MERPGGELGWAITGATVIAWDVLARETMSEAFRQGVENKKTRYAVLGALAITNLHLLDVLPDKADPFKLVLKLAGAALHK